MSLMLSKTYDALTAAGAPEEKARAAAEELANIERLIGKINLIYWMIGVLIAGVASLIIKAFA